MICQIQINYHYFDRGVKMKNIKIDYNGDELDYIELEEETNEETIDNLDETLNLKDSLIIAKEKLSKTIDIKRENFYD